MTVHASPTCEKFVKTYVSTPVRNRVSKATAEAWAKWRVGHPNWKPNPRVQRPRYKMSQHEVVKKVDYACQVETDPKMMEALFPPEDLNPPNPEVKRDSSDVPPVETTDVTVPDTIPPVPAEVPPTSEASVPPDNLIPPYFPPIYGAEIPPVVPTTLHVSAPVVPPGPPESPTTPVVPTAPAPEPSSLALLLLGAGSGTVQVWRSRRTA